LFGELAAHASLLLDGSADVPLLEGYTASIAKSAHPMVGEVSLWAHLAIWHARNNQVAVEVKGDVRWEYWLKNCSWPA
jgi:hypothetical protein